MFINRSDELRVLEEEYRKDAASFSVIYGRRRVGKTALISKYIEARPHIYLYATEGDLQGQLEKFSREIIKLTELPYAEAFRFGSFEEAFTFLSGVSLTERLVLVIDEYQNLCKLDKSFSSTLQKAWDMGLSHSNIHLILCGSVFSMMHSEVLAYDAPLYGRRTSNIHLKAVKFRYLQEFLPTLSWLELMHVYASFGTIPKYLQMYDQTKTLEENFKENILNKNSYLYSEGNFLLKQEINDAGRYFSILENISKGKTKIGDISASLGLHSSYLSKYMQRLIELDIIIKEVPVTETNPLKSRFGRYRIKDKFLNFWFYYVYKNYNYLEIDQTAVVLDEIAKNFNDRFVSFAFEDVVLEDILHEPLKYLDFIPLKIGRWWNKKEEIDLIAFDDDNICYIECKWQNSVDKQKALDQLMQKSKLIKEEKKESFLIITKGDFLNGK